jgi:hypothetical protein
MFIARLDENDVVTGCRANDAGQSRFCHPNDHVASRRWSVERRQPHALCGGALQGLSQGDMALDPVEDGWAIRPVGGLGHPAPHDVERSRIGGGGHGDDERVGAIGEPTVAVSWGFVEPRWRGGIGADLARAPQQQPVQQDTLNCPTVLWRSVDDSGHTVLAAVERGDARLERIAQVLNGNEARRRRTGVVRGARWPLLSELLQQREDGHHAAKQPNRSLEGNWPIRLRVHFVKSLAQLGNHRPDTLTARRDDTRPIDNAWLCLLGLLGFRFRLAHRRARPIALVEVRRVAIGLARPFQFADEEGDNVL